MVEKTEEETFAMGVYVCIDVCGRALLVVVFARNQEAIQRTQLGTVGWFVRLLFVCVDEEGCFFVLVCARAFLAW
jgi:hypothetical protein